VQARSEARFRNCEVALQSKYTDLINLIQLDERITASFDQVCKDIVEKKAIDYVGVYELLKHDKLKKEIFNAHAKQESSRSRANSFASNAP